MRACHQAAVDVGNTLSGLCFLKPSTDFQLLPSISISNGGAEFRPKLPFTVYVAHFGFKYNLLSDNTLGDAHAQPTVIFYCA